jgi:hypothetical protein
MSGEVAMTATMPSSAGIRPFTVTLPPGRSPGLFADELRAAFRPLR